MSAAFGKRILVVEDEADVVDLLSLNLQKNGEFAVSIANDGATGLTKARNEKPALIILDLMLPKMSGLEVCKILKTAAATRDIPVLMLTAKAAEIDRIAGLEHGADDYVTKPFSPREIVLRVKAILRRAASDGDADVFSSGGITIDSARHRVSIKNKQVHLTSIEFKLLQTLAKRRGRVQARDRLLFDVWGYETMIDTRTVDTHVRRLREKLGPAGDVIETVRGFGYKFRDE
jgi:two-component system, OmpR family, phosphate regulon response regulator PhoB